MAIAGLVCGIVSVVFAWVYPVSFVAWAVGVVGIVLSLKAKKEAPSGMATAGLVLSIIGTALGVIGFFVCGVCVCKVKQLADEGVRELTDFFSNINFE